MQNSNCNKSKSFSLLLRIHLEIENHSEVFAVAEVLPAPIRSNFVTLVFDCNSAQPVLLFFQKLDAKQRRSNG